jgi:hypothetical protein
MVDHRKLAEEEDEWWRTLSADERRKYNYDIADYWKALDNRSPYQVKYRRTLFLAQSDLLWKALEEGLSMTVLGHIARKSAREKRPIGELLTEYRESPELYQNLNHKKRVAATPAPKASDEWTRLEQAARDAVSSVLVGEDPVTIEYLSDQFMSSVKLAISELRVRLRSEGNRSVSRERLVGACRQLGVNPPRLGHLVGDQARRNAKAILRDNHPDRTGGNKAQEEVFRQTTEALRVIEDYNELCKKGNGDGHG